MTQHDVESRDQSHDDDMEPHHLPADQRVGDNLRRLHAA